jgi:hypothetical protein
MAHQQGSAWTALITAKRASMIKKSPLEAAGVDLTKGPGGSLAEF